MGTTAWLFLATTVIFLWLAVFLGKGLLKKFGLLDQFLNKYFTTFQGHIKIITDKYTESKGGYIKRVYFHWPGDKKKGMRNIVLEADSPFKVLVGFKLKIPLLRFEGTDWSGAGVSRRDRGTDRAVISTFLWKKAVEFRFLIYSLNPEIHIKVVPPNINTAYLEPDVVCPAHLYQRLGFYA